MTHFAKDVSCRFSTATFYIREVDESDGTTRKKKRRLPQHGITVQFVRATLVLSGSKTSHLVLCLATTQSTKQTKTTSTKTESQPQP